MSRKPLAGNRDCVVLWPTEGSRKTLITHNWCDKTTWLEQSVQVANQAASAATPLLVYDLPDQNIIDVYHGKVWDEDSLDEYRVQVQVSTNGGSTWTTKTEEDPHEKHISGQNGDYVLDYSTGQITFHSSLSEGSQVRASYYRASTEAGASRFTISPSEGKILKLRKAEVQFSKNVVLKDTVIFESYGYVDVFAPQLLNNPFPSGTKIPLTKTFYKTMRDFYNEANGAMPTYPALGGSVWRGLSNEVVVMQWDYAALLSLNHSAGMEVRVYLEHDEAFSGEYATATVYGLSEDE